MPRASKTKAHNDPAAVLPPPTDWRTTDDHELLKRKLRAREERHRVANTDPRHPIFSNFEVRSPSGMTYRVEVRDVASRQFSCTCTDFRVNALGTCKHVEAVLLQLGGRHRAEFKGQTSPRIDVIPSVDGLRVERGLDKLPPALRARFNPSGLQRLDLAPEDIVAELAASRSPALRISQDVTHWLESRRRADERILLRRDYEAGVRDGRHPEHVTLSPLFPYQREGMLHLAFGERVLLADEMGLGKTIQAIAACTLLHHLGKAKRALVVTPASLKTEWEEQIRKFTTLPLRLVFGGRAARARLYTEADPPFFTIANYEQIVLDSLDINEGLRADIVILDEAQRIKNWSTKTAQAVKRLASRYAFVLTGTPIENRIDELRSLVDFLDPALLGPLFRFNREYYTFDDKGRPESYRNLDKLRDRVRPLILRRRKADVETELPDRTDRNLFVPLTPTMRDEYSGYEKQVGDLVMKSKRRPLTPREQDLLMILLNMMRMVCDSPSIIKKSPCQDCPKLDELARVLDESLSDSDVKIIVFSEWEGMLAKVRAWAEKEGIGFAWHTGSVPQKRRRAEILAFRNDPDCRLFLSTDSGGVGLNLQNASVVVNCDLPWNPAKLEQRIARAWRKNQRSAVTVINLIAENTIEHGMLGSLANKIELAQGVLDGIGDLRGIKLKRGRQELLKRLEQVMANVESVRSGGSERVVVSDPAAAFARRARERLGDRLAHCDEMCLPGSDVPVLLAVIRGPLDGQRPLIEETFRDTAWRGDKPALHILDTAAWDALQRLASAGMITIHVRATRPLLPADSQHSLTPEQLARIASLRAAAEKKRRAAQALIAAGLPDEASPLAEAAEQAEAQARIIEKRRA
ncbi:MAG TPA: DEAD/DEAH box helicase [Terrimicrobiaceae bacterium]